MCGPLGSAGGKAIELRPVPEDAPKEPAIDAPVPRIPAPRRANAPAEEPMSLSAIRASVGPDRDSRWSVHDGQFFAEHTLRTNPRAPVERRLVTDAEDQQRLSRQRRAELVLEAAMLPQSADGGGANDDAVKNLEREVDAAKLLRSMWLVSARGRFPEHDGGPHRTEAPRLESAQPARRRGRRGFFPEPPGPPKAPSQILPATVTRALQTGDFAPMRHWLALSGYAENAPRCADSSPHPTPTPSAAVTSTRSILRRSAGPRSSSRAAAEMQRS